MRERTFDGSRVLVTGAAAGIGAAIVQAFLAEGARVAITDVDADAAETLAQRVGSGARAWQLDVTNGIQIASVFAEVVSTFGDIDVVVANAGVSTMRAVVDLGEDEWDFNMDVNAKGVFLTDQAAARHFIARGQGGRIINTASMAGKVGAPYLAHYSASKFAVVGFTQALARELGPHGITVNSVCPGFVVTAMQDREVAWEAKLRGMTVDAVRAAYVTEVPLGRLETPEDVAGAVLFLASDAASYITGEALNVTGGARMD
jgi:meso-butanediol dehydrogenase / (S,S)-butanediol dehydrogenase / diacetyl reductase